MSTTVLGRIMFGLVAAGLTGTQIFAAPLNPGGSIFGPGLPSESGPSLGSSLVASQTNSFIGVDNGNNVVFTGSLISSVWSGDLDNPFGSGFLTFTYQLRNDLSSLDAIGELNLSSFSGVGTDVSILTGSLGVNPLSAARTGFPVPDVKIEFLFKTFPAFQDNLLPGQSSALLVVQTDAPYYVSGNAAIINGGVATANTLVPALVIPEPATASLIVLGAALLAARKRRA